MNIQDGIKKYAITHYANAHNFDNFSTEISSIHFFNADNLEVFYIVPSIYDLTFEITIVNRINPIDSKNKQEIKGSHYAPYYLVSLPFDGSCIARMTIATHKNNLFSDCTMHSLSEMVKNGNFTDFCVIDDDQFDELISARHETIKTGATVITAQRYNDMLDVLPPCRWHCVGGWSVFHVSERLSGNIVSWYAQKNDCYFTFDQDANINDSEILGVLNNA